MASYVQIFALDQFDTLKQQVTVAAMVEAQAFMVEATATPNHAARLAWAISASTNLRGTQEQLLPLILAANASATVGQIQGATDAAVQAQVHSVVIGIVGG